MEKVSKCYFYSMRGKIWLDMTLRESEKTYRHGKQTRLVVLQLEILVGKRLCAVDARRAGAVAVEEVAALDHEVGDLYLFSR